jgi:hypothetical protein
MSLSSVSFTFIGIGFLSGAGRALRSVFHSSAALARRCSDMAFRMSAMVGKNAEFWRWILEF